MSNDDDEPAPGDDGEPDAGRDGEHDAGGDEDSVAGDSAPAPDAGGNGDAAAGDPASTPGAGDDRPGPDEQYCTSCGEIIKANAEICPECGVRNRPAPGTAGDGSKDRVTAGVLAILLGWVGAHKFYLGETGLGVIYLCFFWTGIPGLVGLIEGILYLTKTDAEFQAQYVD